MSTVRGLEGGPMMETWEGLAPMEKRVWKTRKQLNKRHPVEGATEKRSLVSELNCRGIRGLRTTEYKLTQAMVNGKEQDRGAATNCKRKVIWFSYTSLRSEGK